MTLLTRQHAICLAFVWRESMPSRPESPTVLAGALRLLLETSDRIIDEAVKRSPDCAIEILFIGGDH
eukprot:4668408-Pyramimonas_sp.AAC.1